LHSALQQWGASFCRVHHVGYFCNRYTRVRCCRTGWGYSMCGTTLHSNRCGWHVGGWHAGGWHAGGWHLDQAKNQTDDEPADIVEAPSAEQESNPEPAKEGWDNDTSLHSALQQWGASFCRVHHVGYFCNRYTRVRCCRTGWGYSMCGTTLHSNRCGWHVGGWHAGGWHAGGWHLDQATNQTDDEQAGIVEAPSAEQEANPEPAREGWDNDTSLHSALQHWGASFCRVHHVGFFCNRYTRVRCCRTGWGYSMCGTTLHSNRCGWR